MQSRAPIEPRHKAGGRLFKTDQGLTYMGYMVAKSGHVSGKPSSGNSGPSGWKLRKRKDYVQRNANKASSLEWTARRKRIAAAKAARASRRRAEKKNRNRSNRGQ